jgi:hypothetical protein
MKVLGVFGDIPFIKHLLKSCLLKMDNMTARIIYCRKDVTKAPGKIEQEFSMGKESQGNIHGQEKRKEG